MAAPSHILWTGRELNPTPAVQGLSAYRRDRPGREQPRIGDPCPYIQGVADKPQPSSEFRDKDEPVSLAPLSPEDALRALLEVKPDLQNDRERDADEIGDTHRTGQ